MWYWWSWFVLGTWSSYPKRRIISWAHDNNKHCERNDHDGSWAHDYDDHYELDDHWEPDDHHEFDNNDDNCDLDDHSVFWHMI